MPDMLIEIDPETGEHVAREMTTEELAARKAAQDSLTAAVAAREAEKEALSAWLLSRSDLTDGARAAILRALGG